MATAHAMKYSDETVTDKELLYGLVNGDIDAFDIIVNRL